MNMSSSKKLNYVERFFLIILFLILLLLPFTIYFGGIFWSMNAHGIPMSEFVQLREGMSESEVKTLIGEPKGIYSPDDGSKEWSYSRYTFCHIKLRFSPGGKVLGIV